MTLFDVVFVFSGVHTLQVLYGCELDNDGTTKGYYQFGYDGKDFISFDKNTRTWTAAVSQAVISKNKLDPNTAHSDQWKAYLENICIEWLNKYVGYGKDVLERKGINIVNIHCSIDSAPFDIDGGYVVVYQKKTGRSNQTSNN